MAIYSFKIVGVHYAVNSDTALHEEESDIMHQRTAQRLTELDKKRPSVILIPDPTNPVESRAVMARAEGKRIGYVSNEQLDAIHAILAQNGGLPLKARIESVEPKKHGWLYISVETSEEVMPVHEKAPADVWQEWICHLPTLPVIESQFVLIEAELMLEGLLSASIIPSEEDTDAIEHYITLWMDHSLHDMSNEARLMREHYIIRLKELASRITTPPSELSIQHGDGVAHASIPRIKALVTQLEKQRTAICGQKRLNLRASKWWEELMVSRQMEQLWNTWVARMAHTSDGGASEIDTLLHTLPNDLCAYLGNRQLFFSRLYYTQIPREKYWQVISLMLLHEKMQSPQQSKTEGGGKTPHPQEALSAQEEKETFQVIVPAKLQTPEAQRILAKLQKRQILDADLQPSSLKGWQKGALAHLLAERFGIRNVWKEMAMMWKCNEDTLRQYYSKEFAHQKTIDFTKKIKALIY